MCVSVCLWARLFVCVRVCVIFFTFAFFRSLVRTQQYSTNCLRSSILLALTFAIPLTYSSHLIVCSWCSWISQLIESLCIYYDFTHSLTYSLAHVSPRFLQNWVYGVSGIHIQKHCAAYYGFYLILSVHRVHLRARSLWIWCHDDASVSNCVKIFLLPQQQHPLQQQQ